MIDNHLAYTREDISRNENVGIKHNSQDTRSNTSWSDCIPSSSALLDILLARVRNRRPAIRLFSAFTTISSSEHPFSRASPSKSDTISSGTVMVIVFSIASSPSHYYKPHQSDGNVGTDHSGLRVQHSQPCPNGGIRDFSLLKARHPSALISSACFRDTRLSDTARLSSASSFHRQVFKSAPITTSKK